MDNKVGNRLHRRVNICPFCNTSLILNNREEKFKYKKVEIPIVYEFFECLGCGETFTDTEMDDSNINRIKSEYRERKINGILQEKKSL